MTWFWFNHFNVHQYKHNIRAMVGDYEERAIRPHALGRFRDLLGATARHASPSAQLSSVSSATRGALARRTAFCLAALVAAVCAAGSALADNDDHKLGALRLLYTIPIPANLAALHGWDISWVDASTQRFYLADRSNKSVDVVDARAGTFLKAITGGFAGVKFNSTGAANNDISGPNGVVPSGRWLFVTDGGSRVVTIDLISDAVVSSVVTAQSPNRADELAYDPDSGTLLVVNNADDPPFATLIKVNQNTGQLTVARVARHSA